MFTKSQSEDEAYKSMGVLYECHDPSLTSKLWLLLNGCNGSTGFFLYVHAQYQTALVKDVQDTFYELHVVLSPSTYARVEGRRLLATMLALLATDDGFWFAQA
ncbi:hypothetical protein VTP01DRAFT_2981 [Rhizomucor pusillus]|uniref:uncharacterized protein n=1 Tax=Rhizomucor pusillus TaxID=4840 RepID=UPI0037439826